MELTPMPEGALGQVRVLEKELFALEAQGMGVNFPTWHHWGKGLVARTMFMPRGSILTGAMHKEPHLCISVGDVAVITHNGTERISGYNVMPSAGGVKRAFHALADSFWTTVHENPDNCMDVATLEARFTDEAETLGTRRYALLENGT